MSSLFGKRYVGTGSSLGEDLHSVTFLKKLAGETDILYSDITFNNNSISFVNYKSQSSEESDNLFSLNGVGQLAISSFKIADFCRLADPQTITGEKTFNDLKLTTPINDTGTNKFILLDGDGKMAPATMTLNDFNVAVGTPPDMSAYLPKDDIFRGNNNVFVGGAVTGGAYCTTIGPNSTTDKGSAIAVGSAAQATNSWSMAIGVAAQATGVTSIAVGRLGEATGENCIAIGHLAHANGSGGHIAIGYEARADVNNYNAISLGRKAEALNAYCIAIGHYAQATSTRNIAIGKSTVVSGDSHGGNVGIGIYTNINNGHYNLALATANPNDSVNRRQVVVNSSNNIAIGRACQVDTDLGGSIAIGMYADILSNYAIAIGHTAQATTANYGIAIGAEAQATREHNVSIGRFAGKHITLPNVISLVTSDDAGHGSNGFIKGVFIRSANSQNQFRMVVGAYHYSSVGVGANEKLSVEDDVCLECVHACLASRYDVRSDAVLKKNVENITDTSILSELRPVIFQWKDKEEEQRPQYGLIAQEVEEVLPDIVRGQEGNKTVSYTSLIPFLVKKVQEQQAQIDAQQAQMVKKVQEQQAQIDAQQAQIDELRALISEPTTSNIAFKPTPTATQGKQF